MEPNSGSHQAGIEWWFDFSEVPEAQYACELGAAPSFHYVLLLSPQKIAGLGALQRHSRAQEKVGKE
jgi:hypothetical protein